MASLSNSGLADPPRSHPGSMSGSRPPFPCITPSTETCVVVVSFMIAVPFSLRAPLVGGRSPLLRTPLPRSDTASRMFSRLLTVGRLGASPTSRASVGCILRTSSRPIGLDGYAPGSGPRVDQVERGVRTGGREQPCALADDDGI